MITEELLPALQGAIPSALATSDKNGLPNVSYLSQVYFVDNNHVAVSNQFLNKSIQNILENGKATVVVIHPATLTRYRIYMEHRETQREGELFDNMASQLEVIASMMGMQDVFKLNAAEIFEVTEILEIP